MNKPMRIARHVYLRTQQVKTITREQFRGRGLRFHLCSLVFQRRLRHVKGVLIRNLTLPSHTYLADPLGISVYFTVHPQLNPDKGSSYTMCVLLTSQFTSPLSLSLQFYSQAMLYKTLM